VGIFSCVRGVRQGDPLSPLLFCIAEEVLSRAISLAATLGRISPMNYCRGLSIPTHILYADVIMIFCKATKVNIRRILEIFNTYGEASGQLVNQNKSKYYAGAVSPTRLNVITTMLGFSMGSVPFMYLGCSIFEGKPKAIHFQDIADIIKVKLSTWNGSLLSIMGRVQLVNSIIHGMLVFHIYLWPAALLKKVDAWIQNFIWSGDISTRKVCTVGWKFVCRPLASGGLGIRSVASINESLILKLGWSFMASSDQWARLCRCRFLRNNSPVSYHIKSSVWASIKRYMATFSENSVWTIGDGTHIFYWTDNWLGIPLLEALDHLPLATQVSYLIQGVSGSSLC
jgi:hypothetical protein